MPVFQFSVLGDVSLDTMTSIYACCFSLTRSPFCFQQQTKKAIAVYPNSGEVWDGIAKRWLVSGHRIFALLLNKKLQVLLAN
jgi:S-methylmethionine-dependent homocysteine/selenocysteine methylase